MNERPHELRTLTGLRGIAAFVVFTTHFGFERIVPEVGWITTPFRWPREAVNLFFILSGFVLFYRYGRGGQQIPWQRFLRARVARIFPLHLAVLAASLAVNLLLGWVAAYPWPEEYTVPTIAVNALLIQRWPGIDAICIVNPSWSLSVEWALYVLLFPILRALPIKGGGAQAVTVLAMSLGLCFVKSNGDGRMLVETLGISRGVLGFYIGWMLFGHYQRQDAVFCFVRKYRLALWAAGAAILGGFVAGLWDPRWLNLWFPWMALSLACAPETKWLSQGIVYFLGVVSYSLYLWHILLRICLEILFQYDIAGRSLPIRMGYFVGSLLLIPFFAWISFRLIEAPARRWINRHVIPDQQQSLKNASAISPQP